MSDMRLFKDLNGSHVRRILKECKYSQREFADVCGCSQTTVSTKLVRKSHKLPLRYVDALIDLVTEENYAIILKKMNIEPYVPLKEKKSEPKPEPDETPEDSDE